MDKQTINWVKSVLANDESSSDEEMKTTLIDGGLTEEEAAKFAAKRSFYLNNIGMQDDGHSDIGIYKPRTRSVKPLTS